MKYVVRGVHPKTREIRAWAVEAANEQLAAQEMEAKGVQVKDVRVEHGQLTPSRDPEVHVTAAPLAPASDAAAAVSYTAPGRAYDAKWEKLLKNARAIVVGMGVFLLLVAALNFVGIVMAGGSRYAPNPNVMLIAFLVAMLYAALGVTFLCLAGPVQRASRGAAIAVLALLVPIVLLSGFSAFGGLMMLIAGGRLDAQTTGSLMFGVVLLALSGAGLAYMIRIIGQGSTYA